MLDRKIQKSELEYFVGKVGSSWTNPQIFAVCRDMQDKAKVQGFQIPNLHEIYWWIIEERDKLRYGEKRAKSRNPRKTSKKGKGVSN